MILGTARDYVTTFERGTQARRMTTAPRGAPSVADMTTRTLALALALLAAGAPAAAAKPPKKPTQYTYAVSVKGDATYHFESAQPVIGGTLSTTDDLKFRFKAKMPKFQILAGRVVSSGIGQAKLTRVEAKRHQSMPDPLNGGLATGDCAGTTATAGSATLYQDNRPREKAVGLYLIPFRVVEAPFTCTGKLNGPGMIALVDQDAQGDFFPIRFPLPNEAIGMGKVIELFDRKPARCPAMTQDFMTKCELRLKGELTLRRTGKKVFG
jgi:hypothetical protein